MIRCKLSRCHLCDNDCSFSNEITDFYKGHFPVSISTGLFLLAP